MKSTSPSSPPVPWRFSLRAGWRIIALVGVSLVGLAAYGFRAENRRTVAGRARWLGCTCARALRVLRTEVTPVGDVPHGVMLTPNHTGYLDILILASISPTVFVAKAEVQRWPIFGWFAAGAGTLFLRREKKSDLKRVGGQLAPVLAEGVNLAVFLEGTSTDGRAVRDFRPGMLEPIVQLGSTAVPVTISYTVPAGYDESLDVAWWGDMPLVRHGLKLIGVPRIEARVVFGPGQRGNGDRKVLAADLQRAVSAELRESTGS